MDDTDPEDAPEDALDESDPIALALEGISVLPGKSRRPTRSPSPTSSPTTSAHAERPAPKPEAKEESDEDERDEADESTEADRTPALTAEAIANYRKLYQSELSKLPKDQRQQMALTASGEKLFAFCLDTHPGVIKSVLENHRCALAQARLIAQHHGTGLGLDHLGARSQYVRDRTVQRLLLRNAQASEPLLRKILGTRPLKELYKTNMSRELTEGAQRTARRMIRKKFNQAPAEEKIGLLFSTDGRCLTLLTGVPFDQKTTALLCRRTFNSNLLISNLARHAATPPQVIRHLARQQLVKRTPQLKKLLLQHPNCPGELKRL